MRTNVLEQTGQPQPVHWCRAFRERLSEEDACQQQPGEGTASVVTLTPNEYGMCETQEAAQCGWSIEDEEDERRGLRGG